MTEAFHPLHEVNKVLLQLRERKVVIRYLARRLVGMGEEKAWQEVAIWCMRKGQYDLVLECLGGCMRLRKPNDKLAKQMLRLVKG